jgi:hypothetical protein
LYDRDRLAYCDTRRQGGGNWEAALFWGDVFIATTYLLFFLMFIEFLGISETRDLFGEKKSSFFSVFFIVFLDSSLHGEFK